MILTYSHDSDSTCLTNVSQRYATITSVKTIADRLRQARAMAGLTQTELASRAGVSAGTIGNIEAGTRKNPRELLTISRVLGVRPQWLRDDSGPMRASETNPPSSAEAAPGLEIRETRVPVCGLAQLGENGWYEEIAAPGVDGYVDAISSDPDAYGLRVKGDSMFPAIRNGWYVVVEPNGTPSAGEYVAIALNDGRKMVKEFLFRGSDSVSVQSVNGGARLTLLDDQILTIHAVGAVLMPSKHREM